MMMALGSGFKMYDLFLLLFVVGYLLTVGFLFYAFSINRINKCEISCKYNCLLEVLI